MRMPARKNSALQTSETSMVWPKSGCITSPVTATSSSASAMVLAGISGRRADSPNSQATRMTKAGLRNSEGCTLTPRRTIQRREPGRQQHRERRHQIEQMPADEVERIEPEPGGDRRARRQRQDEAAEHER